MAFLSYSICKGQAPVSFYQDSFNGGVTSAGWSPGWNESSGTGKFSVYIPAGSTIRKAYLFAAHVGPVPAMTVVLNTDSVLFDSTTQVTPTFQQPNYGGNSAVCAVDITSELNPSVLNYSLTMPAENTLTDRYTDFCLYIAFDNANLPTVNTAIFLDSRNMTDTMYYIPMHLTYPYTKPSDFGVSMYTGYLCDITGDGEYISLDSVSLGLIGGGNNNSGECGGPIGSFYYYSDTLHGLSGDTSLLLMRDSDAISNAASVIPANTDSIYMRFIHQPGTGINSDNNIWGVILAYGGGDSLFYVTPNVTSVCEGGSVVLDATGANTYTWTPSTALSTSTGDSVIATPTTTTTYTVTGTKGSHTYTTTVTVTVLPAPSITVNAPVMCSGQSTTLIATGGLTYTWSPVLTLSSSTGDSVIATPTTTTTYTVIGKNSNACADTVQAIVTVIPSPIKPSINHHGDTLISSSNYDNQWYRNDTLLTNDTSQELIITALGHYWVTVLNEANGCSTTSDTTTIDSIEGINQLTMGSNRLSVYPNPTTGQFFIKLCDNQNGYTVEIFNIVGEKIYQSVLNNSLNNLNLSSHADGTYFVYLKTEKFVSVRKVLIIKQ